MNIQISIQDIIIPLLAILLILPALPSGKKQHFSATFCDGCTILSSLAVLLAWALCDMHFDMPISNNTGGSCVNIDHSSTSQINNTCLTYESYSVEEVSNAIVHHSYMVSYILGTAMMLELLQLGARRMIHHPTNNDTATSSRSIYTLYNLHDSECLLFVYALLYGTHAFMSHDRGGEVFGLLFAEPISAMEGFYRPISTIRFIEWSMASPILMALCGRSIPRKFEDGDAKIKCVAEIMRPGLVATVSYVYLSCVALAIIDPFWRWTLISFAFLAYISSVINQLTAWRIHADSKAPCAAGADCAMKVQIVVYGIYGLLYMLPLLGWMDVITEQAAMTYADATIKLFMAVYLSAIRQADAFSMAQKERRKADALAADLSQIIQEANAPIFVLDASGLISLWNEKLVQITGAAMPDILNKPLQNFLSDDCRDEFMEIFNARKRGVSGGDQYQCDMVVQSGRNEGDVVSMIMTATARHDAEGKFAGIIGVGSDLTEITRIKAVEETKNQFMAVVSHELKSPLHGIIGLTESLSQREVLEDRRNKLKMVKSCAVRLLDLVSNIMQMSRLHRDQSMSDFSDSLRKDLIDIPMIINEVCTLVTNATDKAGHPLLNPLVKFENRLSDVQSKLPILEGDAYKISQVFYNILTNACKFCRHGSISVDASVNDGRVEVSVSDTGVGIKNENVKRIFEPFEQETNTSRRSFGGIGLGLAISKRVIELHGGEIFVSSTRGQGSIFTVSLPIPENMVTLPPSEVKCSPNPINQLIPQHEKSISTTTKSSSSCLGLSNDKAVILSVDDDIVNQEVIKSTLSDRYDVHIAMSGFEALEFLSTRAILPDLILLDVMMPGMDGFEVLTEIRETKKISPTSLPIIMLSAMEPIDKSVIKSLKSGANDYVSKPFDPDVLLARVKTAVEMKRLTQVENESFHYTKLLHDILPTHIVQRLILGERGISEKHDSVCMLFADIVGWTPMSESVPTQKLLDMLNQLFSSFDALTEKHGVYKADTIGDSYIVAAGHEGLTGPSDATLRVVEFGLDMLDAIKSTRCPDGIQLQMRLGIHTGSCYSGVVGMKVPKYTFFGDTVNTAARMESTGVPGCINMSAFARQALSSEVMGCRSGRSLQEWLDTLGVTLVKRQPIQVKGKGIMDLVLLCPKGISLSLAKRLSAGSETQSNTSLVSLSALHHSTKELSKRELKLLDEIKYLKKEVSRLESSLQSSRANEEMLGLKLQNAKVTEKTSSSDSFDGRSGQTSIQQSEGEPAGLLQQIEELKLQLLVTTKSLSKARQALSAKDEEIDEVQLQLERARMHLLRHGLHGSVANTERISSSISTHRSTFMNRTQQLLDTETPPSREILLAGRRRSSRLSTSTRSLGLADEAVDVGEGVDISNRALSENLFDSMLLGDKNA